VAFFLPDPIAEMRPCCGSAAPEGGEPAGFFDRRTAISRMSGPAATEPRILTDLDVFDLV